MSPETSKHPYLPGEEYERIPPYDPDNLAQEDKEEINKIMTEMDGISEAEAYQIMWKKRKDQIEHPSE